MQAKSLSHQLARFSTETGSASIPESVRRIVRLSLLDWLAVSVAGKNEPLSRASYATITLTSHPRWLSVCNIQSPTTGSEVKFSLRMTAALALPGHDTAALGTFADELCDDRALLWLCKKISVVADEAVGEMQARVQLELQSGETLTAEYDLDAPLAYVQRESKVRTKAAALIGQGRADALWILLVESADDASVSVLAEQVFA